MTFRQRIDEYLRDAKAQGRLNTPRSVDSYWRCLDRFATSVGNRDPRTIGRDEVKGYLSVFKPNTQRRQHAMLAAFFDWFMEEGHRKDNPARQVRRAKQQQPKRRKLTLAETRRFLLAASSSRERWIAYLGVCAGLRRDELRLIQGRHLSRRPGWVWISADIAKGKQKERWIPVLPELAPVIDEILRERADGEFLFGPRVTVDPPHNLRLVEQLDRPGDGKTIWREVARIAKRAGIADMTPHAMRRAFADHVNRHGGVRLAQELLGHEDLRTTQDYLSDSDLEQLAAAVEGLTFMEFATPPLEVVGSQEWRRWESNPRPHPPGLVCGPLFPERCARLASLLAEAFA